VDSHQQPTDCSDSRNNIGRRAMLAAGFTRGFVVPMLLRRCTTALIALLAAGHSIGAAPADPAPPAWHDSFGARLEALALLQTLNADLLSHDSATLTLDRWCAAHHLADPATVTAERVHDVEKAPSAAQRELLHVAPTEAVGYRRVKLHCGNHVLSEADNWYVPSRLTTEMNQVLDTSDVAFGRAVQALRFQRHTLTATLLWLPLPEGWEMKAPSSGTHAGRLDVPHYVLQHTAVLSLPDGTPISTLTETYTAEVLAFTQPRPF
jgi:chorismate-pyruvate lyase